MNKQKRSNNPNLSSRRDRQVDHGTKNKKTYSRGQTISGYKKDDSERSKTRDLVNHRRKIGVFFGIIIAVCCLIAFILTQFVVKINFTNQDSQKISNSSKYADVVEKYYQDNPIERLMIFLDGDNLLHYIQSSLPEVRAIKKISFTSVGQYTISLDMRKPVASWSINNKKFFVDSNGVAFQENYFNAPAVSVIDESGINIDDNSVVASNSFLSFVGKIMGSADKNNVEIDKIVIPEFSLRQIDVYTKGNSYPAKLLVSQSPEGQIEGLAKSINFFNKQGINPTYVDLRAEGKAFYKYN